MNGPCLWFRNHRWGNKLFLTVRERATERERERDSGGREVAPRAANSVPNRLTGCIGCRVRAVAYISDGSRHVDSFLPSPSFDGRSPGSDSVRSSTSNPLQASQMRKRAAMILLCFICAARRGCSFPGDAYKSNAELSPPVHRDRSASTEKASSRCVGPKNREGRCEHPRKCLSDEYRFNFQLAMNHSCTIDRTYVGVCCVNRPRERQEDFGGEERLADILPIVAGTASVARDASKIVWMEEEASGDPEASRGCGTKTKVRDRLVGGRPTDPTDWPWMVALLRKDRSQYCGGVLITDRHVLTAAHCVYRFEPWDIKVRLGEYDFATPDESGALDFAVAEIRVHRDFDHASYENDIAILKMHRPTAFNSYIWPVCLPPIDRTFEHSDAVVIGWGTRYYGGPASTVLMEVGVPIWPRAKCIESYVQRIPGTTMCAGAYEGGRDACQGDSGGPLLHRLDNGRWVTVGIVSWGIRCGEPGRPGVYTRVSSYLDWIFENSRFQ